MRNGLVRKGLVLGIIILFVGAGVAGSSFQNRELGNHAEERTTVTFDLVKTCMIEMDFSVPEILEHGEYVAIELDDSSYPVSKPGEPMIPCVHKVLTFPLGTKILNIDLSYLKIEETTVDKKIVPAQKPLPLDRKKHDMEVFEDKEIYEHDELYPSDWVSYHTSGGLHNGEHVTFLSLHIYPVRYSPKNNVLLFIKDASITIDYRLPRELFITGDDYDLLLIAPRRFSADLQPLIDHKNNLNPPIRTVLVTTEDIYATYSGKDKAEQIKYCIKDAIEKWGIDYVLLIGGLKSFFSCNPDNEENWHVPARYSHLDLDGFPEPKYLCDLYFADIYDANGDFCSWDSNDNGVFGEWRWEGGYQVIDERDLCPDVGFGRLPCRNNLEVMIMVNKIKNYEAKNHTEEGWFKTMLLVGGDSYDDTSPGDNGVIEGKYANLKAYDWCKQRYDFSYVGLWPEEHPGGDTDLTVSNFLVNQNDGSGFTFFSGHGDLGTWFNHQYYTDFRNWINIRCLHLLFLTNGYKLPVVVIAGCHTAGFDKDFHGGSIYFTIECFSWMYTRKIFGGGIATVGNTAISRGEGGVGFTEIYNGYLSTRFFEVYGNGTDILGDIWMEEITQYVGNFNAADDLLHCKTVENWVLIGDPSLRIGGY